MIFPQKDQSKKSESFISNDEKQVVIGKGFDDTLSIDEQLREWLTGRMLLFDELPFPVEYIEQQIRLGFCTSYHGIERKGNHYICNRCKNTDLSLFSPFPCARCQKECVYCRSCLMMGRVSECTPLVTWSGLEISFSYPNSLHWKGGLSPSQKEASEKIINVIKNGGDLLLWAVCGAGKTEMLFEGIAHGLERGKRIAIATPRADVVLELTPRIKQAFPDVPVISLYGGSEDRHRFAPLVITTTHQLLRFERAFDVMIIDEVDAFPFSADEMLQKAAEKAKKKDGSLIFLTATPEEKWQRECISGKRNCVILPARYHRHRIPIPKFHWCGNWKGAIQKGRIPQSILVWFRKRLEMGKQAFIFFPEIQWMERALPLFQHYAPEIEAVHSEDPQRKEKVQKFREGNIPILLTTTILERGVTIPNIDVAVVGAESEIFTESALVQIAGRVGRSPQFPTGDITFFHYGKTRAMIRARNQLLRMNREARRKGLIDD
ncbi:DEAD/DEAH box helicase [Fervidibacillus halotolerans]|uniref:DEAD/DEAH box helicase n=1 Tax=Fervidibacillus halotolerans TaxID=2980027 RepID=A0A9E8RZV9_9BACI|nr:DEAD/DEAH box helicase [Fervidibacillus halotolerans]WAA12032.1 DEAD/DEAH box helicase [Fervidibacillus halotolerans]